MKKETLKKALKSILKKPITLLFPQEPSEAPENFRGEIKYNEDTCIDCGKCVFNCPTGACKFQDPTAERGKRKIEVDLSLCIFCGRCEEVCPTDPKSIWLTKDYDMSTEDKEELEVT